MDRGYIRSLLAVAQGAGIGQIVGPGTAAMLAADDVIDLMRKARILLVDQTVFAAVAGTTSYFNP